MNLLTKQKQTHRHRKQTYGYQKGKALVGINQEFGNNIYTLQYIKYIRNKGLVYSPGNYTQNFVIAYMGKESEKVYILYIYFYIWLNHFVVHLKITIIQF